MSGGFEMLLKASPRNVERLARFIGVEPPNCQCIGCYAILANRVAKKLWPGEAAR
jgi:hypothetical protein